MISHSMTWWIQGLSRTCWMKFKDFQAPVLFSSTFKALNLGEKNSRTFKYFQGCVGTLQSRHWQIHVQNVHSFSDVQISAHQISLRYLNPQIAVSENGFNFLLFIIMGIVFLHQRTKCHPNWSMHRVMTSIDYSRWQPAAILDFVWVILDPHEV